MTRRQRLRWGFGVFAVIRNPQYTGFICRALANARTKVR